MTKRIVADLCSIILSVIFLRMCTIANELSPKLISASLGIILLIFGISDTWHILLKRHRIERDPKKEAIRLIVFMMIGSLFIGIMTYIASPPSIIERIIGYGLSGISIILNSILLWKLVVKREYTRILTPPSNHFRDL